MSYDYKCDNVAAYWLVVSFFIDGAWEGEEDGTAWLEAEGGDSHVDGDRWNRV